MLGNTGFCFFWQIVNIKCMINNILPNDVNDYSIFDLPNCFFISLILLFILR